MKYLIALAVVAIAVGSFLYFVPEEAMPEAPAILPPGPETHAPITLVEQEVTLPGGETARFRLPEGFGIAAAAEGLGKARFMALSPDGRIFFPDIVDYKLSHQGKVWVVGDFDEETKTFGEVTEYLTGLRGPNSVAFYTDDDGKHWLYIALTAHLVRYPYQPGDTEPTGPQEIIAEFPNSQSPGEVSVVWHITRTIFIHDDRIYVSVGSGCNSCEQLAGDMRAMIYSMKPDGSDKRVYADGLRNTVGITMAEGELYATANGVDHLGEDRPDEVMYKVEEGADYGWPFCYATGGEHVPDTTQAWADPVPCESVPPIFTSFPPRSAPLGLRYFPEGAHPILGDSFLVALHGSFDPAMRSGYEIRRVLPDGSSEVFMDGFLEGDTQLARPVDFLPHDEGFFFTDDHGGRIYYVYPQE